MKQRLAIVAAAAASMALAACEDTYFHHPAPNTAGYVDGYYDDFYGPFQDGYWGAGGVFYYRTSRGGDWRRDDGRHFTHDAGHGFNAFHVRAGEPRPPGG
ncbi:MAG TPA: hypothetical protein VFE13_09915 [Caulobacteraceae bacterium]|nr:hypothetical protein [Caulobacteraceae bacterium]